MVQRVNTLFALCIHIYILYRSLPGAAIRFLQGGERSQPQPQGPQARGAVDYNVRGGGPGAPPPEIFQLPHPKFVGWGRILDPLYWKEQALKFSKENCSELLLHTHTHTHRRVNKTKSIEAAKVAFYLWVPVSQQWQNQYQVG